MDNYSGNGYPNGGYSNDGYSKDGYYYGQDHTPHAYTQYYNQNDDADYYNQNGPGTLPPPKKKKRKKWPIVLGICGGVGALIVAGVIVFLMVFLPSIRYNSAVELYDKGKYSEAAKTFKALGDYEESEKYLDDCKNQIEIGKADKLFEDGDYLAAAEAYMKLKNYDGAEDKVLECAQKLYDAENYTDAKTCYEMVDGTEKSVRSCNLMLLAEFAKKNGEEDKDGAYCYEKTFYEDKEEYELSINYYGKENYVYLQYFSLTSEDDYALGSTVTLYFFPDEIDDEIMIQGKLIYVKGDAKILDTGTGILDISTCTASTDVKIVKFEREGKATDGSDISSTNMDDSDSLMVFMKIGYQRMIPNLNKLFSGTGVTPAEIGFKKV